MISIGSSTNAAAWASKPVARRQNSTRLPKTIDPSSIGKFIRAITIVGLFCGLVISTSQNANASWPGFVPDSELAARPLIVVAKWNGAPSKNNSLLEANVLKVFEVATEIEVQRVVKGDIAPGKLTILLEYGIGWSNKEPRVTSYTSTEVWGDADGTVDNLWFLSKKRSRVDGQEYYCLDNYRGVQPLALEPYFKAHLSGMFAVHIPELLAADDEIIPMRTLVMTAGGNLPWPYVPPRFRRVAKPGAPLKEYVVSVRSLIEKSKSQEVRRYAAAVYGLLADPTAVDFFRRCLADADPVIRAIAVGSLAQLKDRESADSMAQAVKGLDDVQIACELIKHLDGWRDPSAVPALIEFLQNDGYAGRLGTDLHVPAIKSREVLFQITQYHFPVDVVESRAAWKTAREIQDAEARRKHLESVIPSRPNPFQALLVIEGDRAFVEVTNRSLQASAILKYPTDITYSYSKAGSGGGFGETPSNASDFVTLDPGKSHRFELHKEQWSNIGSAKALTAISIDLAYISNGNKFGINGWVGILSVGMP